MSLRSAMYLMAKRTLDVSGAIVGLVVFALPMLVIAGLIYRRMGRPILFTQERAGKHGDPFTIYKFRTMTNETDEAGDLLPAEDRITPLGHKLRTTTLDELPEFFNVLRGEMSLVGPRPLHTKYNDRYDEFQAQRLSVKPGMTGLAVIRGRETLAWENRFEHDVEYVVNRSVLLDLTIILKTILMVVTREGSEPDGGKIKEEFHGQNFKDE